MDAQARKPRGKDFDQLALMLSRKAQGCDFSCGEFIQFIVGIDQVAMTAIVLGELVALSVVGSAEPFVQAPHHARSKGPRHSAHDVDHG